MHSKAKQSLPEQEQAPLTDVGAVLELLDQLESEPAGPAGPPPSPGPGILTAEIVQYVQSLHDDARVAAERCEAFLAGPGTRKKFRAAVDAEREALANYGFESYSSFTTTAAFDPRLSVSTSEAPVASRIDNNELSDPLRERVSELLGLSCATRDVAISAAKAALTRASSTDSVSAAVAGLDPAEHDSHQPEGSETPSDESGESLTHDIPVEAIVTTTTLNTPASNFSQEQIMDEATQAASGGTAGVAPNDMLRMVEAIGAVRANASETLSPASAASPVEEAPVEAWTVEVPSLDAPPTYVAASLPAHEPEPATPVVSEPRLGFASPASNGGAHSTSTSAIAGDASVSSSLDALLAPLATLGDQILAAIEATRVDAANSIAAITAEGSRVQAVLESDLRRAAAARTDAIQTADRAQQEAAAIVDAAVKEAEQVKADAVAEVERVRDRLTRLSAEVFSVAAELER
jgi:hypothetical protein